jgi:hypothetical protein
MLLFLLLDLVLIGWEQARVLYVVLGFVIKRSVCRKTCDDLYIVINNIFTHIRIEIRNECKHRRSNFLTCLFCCSENVSLLIIKRYIG